jgi:hypothetical protein
VLFHLPVPDIAAARAFAGTLTSYRAKMFIGSLLSSAGECNVQRITGACVPVAAVGEGLVAFAFGEQPHTSWGRRGGAEDGGCGSETPGSSSRSSTPHLWTRCFDCCRTRRSCSFSRCLCPICALVMSSADTSYALRAAGRRAGGAFLPLVMSSADKSYALRAANG